MAPTRTALASARRSGIGRSAMNQARTLWQDAVAQPLPADRFRLAHLCALRATAALLAARTEPGSRLAHRPTSAWVLLPRVAPDFAAWAAYFASGVSVRQAADAGVVGAVTEVDAAQLVEAVRTYLFLIEATLAAGDSALTAPLLDGIVPADFPPPTPRVHRRLAG